jgi:type IV secretion system protein VirB6
MDITTLLSQVDTFGNNFVSQAYQALSSALTGGGTVNVAGLLLTLYIMFWGFGVWQGTAGGGPAEYAFRLFRAFAIYALATSWSDFQTYAYDVMNTGPSAIGNSLLTTVSANGTGTSANLSSTSSVQSALQNLWTTTGASVEAFVKNAGVLNPGPYVIAGILIVVVAILIGYAVFLIILSKLFMWLLLALAPLFILMLLFGFTTRYFSGWVNAIIQYFFVQVLVYALVAFFVSISQTYFDQVNTSNGSFSTTIAQLLPVILISVIGVLLLAQVTNVAAQLAGGLGLGVISPGRFFGAPLSAGQAIAARVTGRPTFQERAIARRLNRIGAARGDEGAASRLLAEKLKTPAS